MTAYKHQPKPIPVARDVPTVAAPAPLGSRRWVNFAWDDIRAIAVIKITDDYRRIIAATRAAWPVGGGRAVIVYSSKTNYDNPAGEECWTEAQLVDALIADGFDRKMVERAARRVWAHKLRADPADWDPDDYTAAFEIT